MVAVPNRLPRCIAAPRPDNVQAAVSERHGKPGCEATLWPVCPPRVRRVDELNPALLFQPHGKLYIFLTRELHIEAADSH